MPVKNKVMIFDKSDSPDVVGYRLYLELSPNSVGYDSAMIDLGDVNEVTLNDIADLSTMDGVYNIGLVSVDDAGNLSSMAVVTDIPLDFIQPNPPMNLRIV